MMVQTLQNIPARPPYILGGGKHTTIICNREGIPMPDYQLMYHILFNHITDTIESLQMIQRQAESLYINHPEPELRLLHDPDPGDGK